MKRHEAVFQYLGRFAPTPLGVRFEFLSDACEFRKRGLARNIDFRITSTGDPALPYEAVSTRLKSLQDEIRELKMIN